jgi:phosphoribosylamine--glycine ligase
MRSVVDPTLRQMEEEGSRFRGFLYVGLALTAEGPKVLEFNVRLGDPETQAILPRMKNDLVDVIEGAAPEWTPDSAVNVVLAAEGYPESPIKEARIRGLDAVPDDVLVFHAGTRLEGRQLLVDGGRVLDLVGIGASVGEARNRAYEAVAAVSWPGMQHRADIAAQS